MMSLTAWTKERQAVFRLARTEGLGPIKLRRLLDVFGSAESILRASPKDLVATPGIGDALALAILDRSNDHVIDKGMDDFDRAGVRVLFEDDDEYPFALREIYDNPVYLTIRGSIQTVDRLAVAIVGSRRCTRYGLEQAERFASGLASRGVTIISGLARGIDGAAHRGALSAGGRTIAVLASGLANIYPPEHTDLAEEVAAQGALVSEAPINGVPIAGLFPQRNRVISGMSLGVLVVEAAERSGALSTAHHAAEQNRDVFAIPGRLIDPASKGTNRLLRQGAIFVTSPEEVLEHLGPLDLPLSAASEETQLSLFNEPAMPTGLGEVEQKIWQSLAGEEISLDLVLERTGLDTSTISATLLTMELGRWIDRLPGGLYRRRLT
jgi:DNA processing protein